MEWTMLRNKQPKHSLRITAFLPDGGGWEVRIEKRAKKKILYYIFKSDWVGNDPSKCEDSLSLLCLKIPGCAVTKLTFLAFSFLFLFSRRTENQLCKPKFWLRMKICLDTGSLKQYYGCKSNEHEAILCHPLHHSVQQKKYLKAVSGAFNKILYGSYWLFSLGTHMKEGSCFLIHCNFKLLEKIIFHLKSVPLPVCMSF